LTRPRSTRNSTGGALALEAAVLVANATPGSNTILLEGGAYEPTGTLQCSNKTGRQTPEPTSTAGVTTIDGHMIATGAPLIVIVGGKWGQRSDTQAPEHHQHAPVRAGDPRLRQ
jgi:hypothetical protein